MSSFCANFMDIAPGDKFKLIGFKSSQRQLRRKLLSMGLTPNIIIEIKRIAPLGDPVEIKIRGYSLSLRRHETDGLILEKI